jgi:hypothetical protein
LLSRSVSSVASSGESLAELPAASTIVGKISLAPT